MDTLQIIKYMRKFSKFKGVYPRDMLPSSLSSDRGLVINTDKSTEPGEHWVAIYKYKNGSTVYFDSFGLPPLHIEILQFLNKIAPLGWYHNTITFQSAYQDSCGLHCIFFLTCMFKYEDFTEFQNVFNSKPDFNDILAKIIYKVQENKI